MSWTRRHTLFAGLGLVALTNAIALGGAAWNRSGEEARLHLTQRELRRSYVWYGNRENSGISLNLVWRALNGQASSKAWSDASTYAAPAWLDPAKMQSLGFDTSGPAGASDNRGGYEKQLPREVLIVLEMDGPAWQHYLESAREHVARLEANTVATDRQSQLATKTARDWLEREAREGSRLLAVDAGLDAAVLREKYPDKERYAIVRGLVRPLSYRRGSYSGIVANLSVSEVNVPLELRRVFPEPASSYTSPNLPPLEATVAFGKRLEPWIVAAARK
jgi:Domain of unknown function (DUF4824)